MIDVDKDWEILSWLSSPAKRIEKCHEAAWNKAYQHPEGEKASKEEFKKLTTQFAQELGCPPQPQQSDPLLRAIEGRGSTKEREPALNFGLGAARVFQPEEVRMLAVSFSQFDPATLRRNFDREEMTRFNVGGMDWESESDAVLAEFLIPSFKQLHHFYQRAAKLKHYVLVIYQ